MKFLKKTIFLMLFLCVFSISFAYSYIDPNFGSMLLQVLAAGFFGGLYFVKIYWQKIKTFTTKVFKKKK